MYRILDPSLPDLGWTRMLPRIPDAAAARAIHQCTDAAALGAMLGAARSFWGSAGMVVIAAFGGPALALLGWDIAAVVVLGAGAIAGNGTIEARRRSRQWAAIIETRVAQLGGTV